MMLSSTGTVTGPTRVPTISPCGEITRVVGSPMIGGMLDGDLPSDNRIGYSISRLSTNSCNLSLSVDSMLIPNTVTPDS